MYRLLRHFAGDAGEELSGLTTSPAGPTASWRVVAAGDGHPV